MTINADYEYLNAQKEYLSAKTDEEKLKAIEKMLQTAPTHKGSENLRANLRARYKKLKEAIEKKKKQKKSSGKKEGIKKEGIQVVLIGLTQSGKSSLISTLTNANPEITGNFYTTKQETIGTLYYEGIKFQIIDMPAINHETFDSGLANTADILLIIITNIHELEQIFPFLEKTTGKRIIAFNKSDLLSEEEKRKISSYLASKKYNFVLISTKTKENIDELEKKLFENSGIIRIYTKQPGKPIDSSPVILKPNSTVKDLAEKILHGLSSRIKEIRITGPSSKFPNQIVGLKHILKDRDIVEFRTE